MSKMGRPKSDNPKNKKVSTRLSEAEYDRLKLYASKHSLTISEVNICILAESENEGSFLFIWKETNHGKET